MCPFQLRSTQEEMAEQLKQVGALRSEHAINLDDEESSNRAHSVDGETGPPCARSNRQEKPVSTESSSLVEEEVNAPVSSLVKLMFGIPKTTNHTERGTQESANHKLQAAELVIQSKVGELEAEIANFQESNRRLGVIMKENAAHMSRLMRERAAWEIQKKADMDAFQQYKEAQMNKLLKDKCKFEHQIRGRSIPQKDERKEIEELRAKLAEERELRLKKDLQWRQTSNRIRGVNDDLKNKIHELRKEIAWHEDRLILDAAAKDSDPDSNARNCRPKARGPRNVANRCTSIDNIIHQPRERARKERNVNTTSSEMCGAALHPAKFKVEITKKKEVPTTIKLDIVRKDNNNNKAKTDLRDNSTTIPALDTLSNCEAATTALATKMKRLEKEVQQWIAVHSKR